jgi:phage terminase small subunit
VPERPGSGATEGGSIPPARAPKKRAPRKSQQADQWTAAEREQMEAKSSKPLDLNRILNAEGAPDPTDTLTPTQRAFVREYLTNGRNGTAAWLAASPTCKSANAAAVAASQLILTNPNVRAAIKAEDERLQQKFDFTREDALRYFLGIAYADPAELMQLRHVSCDHCWPTDPKEGTGDWTEPNPECPKCHGQGVPRLWFADTRRLSPQARRLFAGVHKGKDGLRMLTHNQTEAAKEAARLIGAYELDNQQKAGGAAEVLRQFFAEMHGAARLPISKPDTSRGAAPNRDAAPGGPLGPRL